MSDDVDRFIAAIGSLAIAFGKAADKPFFDAYEIGLEGIPIATIEAAAAAALRSEKFMPTPARLRELGGEPTPGERAALAWQAVRRNRAKFYTRELLVFDDPAITATVANLGGAERFYYAEPGEELDTWLRKEFERVYSLFASHPPEPQPIAGVCRSDNAYANGQPLPRPTVPRLIATGLPWVDHHAALKLTQPRGGAAALGLTVDLKTVGSDARATR